MKCGSGKFFIPLIHYQLTKMSGSLDERKYGNVFPSSGQKPYCPFQYSLTAGISRTQSQQLFKLETWRVDCRGHEQASLREMATKRPTPLSNDKVHTLTIISASSIVVLFVSYINDVTGLQPRSYNNPTHIEVVL